MRKLLVMVLASLKSIAHLALLLVLLIFIYTLIGMQFLSGPFSAPQDPDDVANLQAQNFDSFPNAVIAVFILVTSENWNGFTSAYIFKDGWGSSIYFVSIIMFGNMMILNLFLAILLNSISENLEEETEVKVEVEAIEDNFPNASPSEVALPQNVNEIIEEELDYI